MMAETILTPLFNAMKNGYKSDITWVFIERILSSALNLISIITIARFLGPLAYGQFAFAISLLSIAIVTGHLGLDGLLIKKLVEQKSAAPTLLGTTLVMKFIIYIPMIMALITYAWTSAELVRNERILLLIMSIICLTAPFTASIMACLNARQIFRRTAYRRIISTCSGTIGKVSLIMAGHGVIDIGFVHAAMFILEAILLYQIMRKVDGPSLLVWRFGAATAKKLLSESSYLFLATVFAMIYISNDVLIMRYILDSRSVGEYAIVPQILMSSQMIPYAITLVAFPKVIEKMQDDPLDFVLFTKKLALRLLAISIAVTLPLFVIGPYLIAILFGDSFANTGPVFQIACLAIPFMFLRQLTTKLFICLEDGKKLAMIEFVSLIINFGANISLITDYGLYGAAYSIIITYFFTIGISSLYLYKRLKQMAGNHE